MPTLNLECPCKSIALEVSGDPLAQFYCHCDDCQKMHGGAYMPESVYKADHVKVTRGEPAQWVLSRNPRFFCSSCGAKLFVDVVSMKLRGVNGYLLPKEAFQAKLHVNCDFAVRPLKDELPHFRRMPASFGGSDDKVDW